MRQATTTLTDALRGSFTPATVVDSWYDGDAVYPSLPMVEGEISWDATRAITGSLKASFAGDDPRLDPLASWDAPLACWGSQLHVRAGARLPGGDALVSLGWYVIDTSDPQEWWQPYTRDNGTTAWVNRGRLVAVDAADRLLNVDEARMLAPEQPAQTASTKAEIARLVDGLVPLGDLSAVPDAALPRAFAYDESRTTGLATLAASLGAYARIGSDGALTLVPIAAGTTPDLIVTVDDNAVTWSGRISRDTVFNRVIATGEGDTPVYGQADLTTGPLRWGGPFGRRPFAFSSPLLATPDAAQAAAASRLASLAAERVIIVTVEAIANPLVEVGDTAQVIQPARTLVGTVQAVAMRLPLSTMTLQVAVPAGQLAAVLA